MYSAIIPLVLGGLGLFIYAIFQLSEVLKTVFSDRAKAVIERYTSNTLLSLLIGTIMTVMLGSSSAVIILVIVFINSRALTFRHAMGLILGANIGTTFSSQLIALDIGKYSVIPLLLGLLLLIFTSNERIKYTAKAMMYFGMLFFGLFVIEESAGSLRDSEVFVEWISSVEGNPVRGALIGGFITLVVQSSSGTVGMAIVLGKQGLLSLAGGLAIMLGAELGTCSDTLIATIGGSRQGIKAGIFHLTANLVVIVLALMLFNPFVDLVQHISSNQIIGNQIANGHVLFNVLGVLLCLPFLNLFERGLNALLPDRKEKA